MVRRKNDERLAHILLALGMSKMIVRILLIEDDPSVGTAMKGILEVFGYDVHWSSSLNDAFHEIVDDEY